VLEDDVAVAALTAMPDAPRGASFASVCLRCSSGSWRGSGLSSSSKVERAERRGAVVLKGAQQLEYREAGCVADDGLARRSGRGAPAALQWPPRSGETDGSKSSGGPLRARVAGRADRPGGTLVN
jgi:hypothetical protein